MTDVLKSETALLALKTMLAAATGVPPIVRNDVRLASFAASGVAGVGWKLAMLDDDIGNPVTELGEGEAFELTVGAELVLAVEGEPGDDRDEIFAGAMFALAAALTADRTLGGACDGLSIAGNVQRDHITVDGGVPIETARIGVTLLLTAETELG